MRGTGRTYSTRDLLKHPEAERFGVTMGRAGRVAAGSASAGLEESPDTEGQDAGASQAAKADGKWNRKETASGVRVSPETPAVRVKRWGKSPPASW